MRKDCGTSVPAIHIVNSSVVLPSLGYIREEAKGSKERASRSIKRRSEVLQMPQIRVILLISQSRIPQTDVLSLIALVSELSSRLLT